MAAGGSCLCQGVAGGRGGLIHAGTGVQDWVDPLCMGYRGVLIHLWGGIGTNSWGLGHCGGGGGVKLGLIHWG